ncbi:hypothetical protein [Spirosoma gilvum]
MDNNRQEDLIHKALQQAIGHNQLGKGVSSIRIGAASMWVSSSELL